MISLDAKKRRKYREMRISVAKTRLMVSAWLLALAHCAALAQSCLLIVEQPVNSPSVIRASANQVLATGSLKLSQPAIGSWLVYLKLHLKFRPAGSGTWTEVDYYETMTSVPAGSQTGFSLSSGPIQKTLEPRGNGDYQSTLTTHGVCGGTDYPLTPTNPSPSTTITVRRPTISSNMAGMWWFGEVGKNDVANRYYSAVTLTGTPNWEGTLAYSITQGETRARLSCTNCNSPQVDALAPSAGCAADVEV
jgi:hypothetical protein